MPFDNENDIGKRADVQALMRMAMMTPRAIDSSQGQFIPPTAPRGRMPAADDVSRRKDIREQVASE